MAMITLLEHCVPELENTMEYLNKKKKRKSRTRLQSSGVLHIGDAQEMIRQAAQAEA
jgi:hypothetical protein